MTRIDADWLRQPATQAVFDMLESAGHQAYAVGGCARDSLLGVEVTDIDVSTDALPSDVLRLAETAGLHAVPTGIDHGTVTVVSDHVPHEITTFRRDVATDGRRATVAFTKKMDEDARRRDFTMNALYVRKDGEVIDPLGGMGDLTARRIRFIEDADQRIREDYLRSLRFFRFHAWYGNQEDGFDPQAIDAIARNVDGISGLSRERVGAELLKLLAAPDPAPAVAGMRSTGVLMSILPGADDRALAPLVHLEQEFETAPNALRRLVVLGGSDLSSRLRLSRKESEVITAIKLAMTLEPGEAGYRCGAEVARDGLLVLAASLGQTVEPGAISAATISADQVFPLRAADLMPAFDGVALGQELKSREQAWIDSGFELSRDELLAIGDKRG